MKLKYKFCNIFSEFSFEKLLERFFTGLFVLLIVMLVVILYTYMFEFLASVIGSTTTALLSFIVYTIIVLFLGSRLAV